MDLEEIKKDLKVRLISISKSMNTGELAQLNFPVAHTQDEANELEQLVIELETENTALTFLLLAILTDNLKIVAVSNKDYREHNIQVLTYYRQARNLSQKFTDEDGIALHKMCNLLFLSKLMPLRNHYFNSVRFFNASSGQPSFIEELLIEAGLLKLATDIEEVALATNDDVRAANLSTQSFQ